MAATDSSNELSFRARDEGVAWAARRIAELTVAGRTIRGGWPGTMSEAKHLAAARVCRALRTDDQERFQLLSHTLYESAKRHWLAQRVRGGQQEE